MPTESLKGSLVMTNLEATPIVDVNVNLRGGRVRRMIDKVTIAAKSVGSTYLLARMPSHAILLPQSRIYWDKLDAGTATMDIGIINRPGLSDITDDVNALWSGIDVTSEGNSFLTGTGGLLTTTAIVNLDQELWDYVSGETKDPKALLDIQAISVTTDWDTVGDIVLELFYIID